jgi:hypothetical protein
MSSHHIIRDNQEPALVLFSKIDEELLRQLCGWSPLIYCSHLILDWVQMLDMKIDFIFGPAAIEDDCLKKMDYQFPVKYFVLEDEEKFDLLIQSIDNSTVQIVKDENPLRFPNSEKTISFFNDEFKAYQFTGFWKKWKSKGETIYVENFQTDSVSNLTLENENLRVLENGIVSFQTLGKTLIKEYH